jgi:hypothetical protein
MADAGKGIKLASLTEGAKILPAQAQDEERVQLGYLS